MCGQSFQYLHWGRRQPAARISTTQCPATRQSMTRRWGGTDWRSTLCHPLSCWRETRQTPPPNLEEQNTTILYSGFNRRPFQLLRSYKRHEENRRKIGQERSSMQQAHYQCHRPTPWMQESVSMHKSPTPVRHSRMNQAREEEEEKERQRQSNKTKTYSKQGLPRHSSG